MNAPLEGPPPLLAVEDIHTYYGDSYILQGVSLRVAEGKTVAVLGRNGVGKTTLIRSLIGFTPPRRGRVAFAGQEITGRPPEQICRLGLTLVPQGRRIFRSLTVEETLAIAARRPAAAEGRAAWTAERVYGAFPRLQERRRQRAGTLSGGEQQMLATGRALVGNPRLILLDEPTEGLSPLLVRELQTVLRALRQEGVTLLVVEQRVKFALALADRVYLMSKGRIVHETDPVALESDSELRHTYLGV